MKINFVNSLIILMISFLVLNMILLVLGKLKALYFWIVIAIMGIFAYLILPRLRKSYDRQ